jgi:hypothetical protein
MNNEERIAALREEVRATARMMARLHRRQIRPRVIWSGVRLVITGSLVTLVILNPDYLLLLITAHLFAFPLKA